MIEKNYSIYLIDNLDKFDGLNHIDIAIKLIDEGKGALVVSKFKNFTEIDEKDYFIISIHLLPNNRETFLKFNKENKIKATQEQVDEYLNKTENEKLLEKISEFNKRSQFTFNEIICYQTIYSDLCQK